MESTAQTTLPDEPPNGVTGGIDWARDDHAVSIVDHRGREIVRSTVEHNAAGLRELLAVLARAGVREVAIERPDGLVAGIGQHCGQFGESGDRLGYASFGDQQPVGIHQRDVVMILGPVDPTRDHGQHSSLVVE
jgi:hypothetical protein